MRGRVPTNLMARNHLKNFIFNDTFHPKLCKNKTIFQFEYFILFENRFCLMRFFQKSFFLNSQSSFLQFEKENPRVK